MFPSLSDSIPYQYIFLFTHSLSNFSKNSKKNLPDKNTFKVNKKELSIENTLQKETLVDY